MHQVFLIGPTKSGKSTLAQKMVEHGFIIYEAGAWARKNFQEEFPGNYDEMCPKFKDELTKFAMSKLEKDYLYSFKKYQEFLEAHPNEKKIVIAGVRNPDDFINMQAISPKNHVIFLQTSKKHTGSLAKFESGISVIFEYVKWKQQQKIIPSITMTEDEIFHKEISTEILKNLIGM